MKAANRAHNNGVLRDDVTGEIMVDPGSRELDFFLAKGNIRKLLLNSPIIRSRTSIVFKGQGVMEFQFYVQAGYIAVYFKKKQLVTTYIYMLALDSCPVSM